MKQLQEGARLLVTDCYVIGPHDVFLAPVHPPEHLHFPMKSDKVHRKLHKTKVRNRDKITVRHRVNPSAIELSCSKWLAGKVSAETFGKVQG